MQPFVVERSKSYEKKNAQFRDCQRNNRPLVTITPSRKFALVEIDMFPTDKNLDSSVMDEIGAVLAQHAETGEIKVSAIQCYANRIPRVSAESVATKLYDIALNAMPNLPPAVPVQVSRDQSRN
jgi:hypothetical protein